MFDSTFVRDATLLGAAAALLLAACAGDSPTRRLVTASDSAGIVIHTHPVAVFDVAPVWRTDSVATVRIGTIDGDTLYQLYGVRGVRTLRSGRIAVLNLRHVRIYDGGGRFVRSFAGPGEGSGELHTPLGLWPLPGDSLLVFDAALKRLTVYREGGTVRRVTALEGASASAVVAGRFDDGSLLVLDDRLDPPPITGLRMYYTDYLRYAADGARIDSLPRQEFGMLGPVGDPSAGMVGGPLFAVRRDPAVGGAAYWVPGAAAEVRRYSAAGDLDVIVRWDAGDLSVTPAEVEQWREQRLRGVPAEFRDERARQLEALPVADHHAAVRRMLTDADGRLWAEVNPRPGYRGPSQWLIIDDDGVIIARAELPPRFSPHEIGRDHVLGVERDVVDIEYVVRYRLRR